jgi:hypothetical protein
MSQGTEIDLVHKIKANVLDQASGLRKLLSGRRDLDPRPLDPQQSQVTWRTSAIMNLRCMMWW